MSTSGMHMLIVIILPIMLIFIILIFIIQFPKTVHELQNGSDH